MATNQQYTSNLGLAVLPELQDADPRLYQEFVKVYNAIKVLATNLDKYSGLEFRDSVQQAQYSTAGQAANTMVGVNGFKLYKVASVTLSYGQMVYINSAGQVALANGGFNGTNSVVLAGFFKPAHFVVTSGGTTNAGSVVEISSQAIINTSGLTPGRVYQLNGAGIADFGSFFIAGSVNVNNGIQTQDIGVAVSATELFFIPDNYVSMQYLNDTVSISLAKSPIYIVGDTLGNPPT